MDPVIVCSCGARLRLKPGLVLILNEVKCGKCGKRTPIPKAIKDAVEAEQTQAGSSGPASIPTVVATVPARPPAPPPAPAPFKPVTIALAPLKPVTTAAAPVKPPTLAAAPVKPAGAGAPPTSQFFMIDCSGCGKKMPVSRALAGKRIKCKSCSAITLIKVDNGPTPAPAAPPAEAPAAARTEAAAPAEVPVAPPPELPEPPEPVPAVAPAPAPLAPPPAPATPPAVPPPAAPPLAPPPPPAVPDLVTAPRLAPVVMPLSADTAELQARVKELEAKLTIYEKQTRDFNTARERIVALEVEAALTTRLRQELAGSQKHIHELEERVSGLQELWHDKERELREAREQAGQLGESARQALLAELASETQKAADALAARLAQVVEQAGKG